MNRRAFIGLIGGAAAWPLASHAQRSEQMRLVGVLMGSADHADARSRLEVFVQAFRHLGWIDGRNVRLDIRWGRDPQSTEANARELVELKPDVILAGPTNAVIPLQQKTRDIPIVFVSVSDPVGHGIVENLARPTGNLTGFSNLEPTLMGKWLQLIKEAAPPTKRVALMISTSNASSPVWYRMFNAVAPGLEIEPISAPIGDRTEIEGVVKSIAQRPNSALLIAGDTLVSDPPVRRSVIELTAAHRLPAVYGEVPFAADGGLIAYGIDRIEPYRHAASYVDRILKGEKPANLPVQQPTKFQLVINLKTAKALGLELSPTLVGTADEVIE
jgi:putative ABC transport system substrate-binding protein